MRWLLFLTIFAVVKFARADFFDADEAAKKFAMSPGYVVQTIAAEPMLENPVAFSMDEKGRIWIAETHRLDNAVVDITKNTNWLRDDLSFRVVSQRERFLTNAFGTNAAALTRNTDLLRLLTPGASGRMENSEMAWGGFRTVTSGLMAGVLARDNRVWVACIPNLWRLDDYGGPLEGRRSLSGGYGVHIGVTGHDLHGLTMGMDGKIYFSIGDRGFSVRSGPATFNYPDTGAVLRCNVDGGELEVVATGLRNPQELAFDELGNLWSADNDTAGEDKSRLIHVIEGADYGWRTSYQHMKGFGPWVQEKVWEGKIDGTLPTAGEPAQGPAGLAYYPGTGMGEEMKGRFLLCDFPGGIQTFTVEPKGASYVIKDKKRFLWNCWPTDVEFGTDGYCYFSDWVGGWTLPNKGRIYRLVQPNAPANLKIAETAKILQGGFDDKDLATLLGYLERPDQRVRLNAHLALGKKKDANAALRQFVLDASKPRTARLHAIWALRLQGAIEAKTVATLVDDADPEIRAQAVGSASITNIVKLLRDENPRVKLYAAQALQRKALFDPNNSGASQAILELLEKNADSDPFLTHAGVRVLVFSPPALLKARKHTSVSVRRAAMLASRSIGSITIGAFLDDPALMYEAARAIYDVPITSALPKLAERLTTNCPPEIHTRAINANFRLGGAEPARRVAAFAASANVPARSRIEALECLADWEYPDEIDRVVGLWRPIKPDALRRSSEIVRAAVEPHWTNLWRETNADILKAALTCAEEVVAQNQATNVLAIFNDKSRGVEVRSKALEVLRDLDETNFARAIEAALKEEKLRIGALGLVQTNSPVVARVVEMISKENDVATLQAALAVIRKATPSEAVEPLKKLIGKAAPELALDVSQTAALYPALKEGAEIKNPNPLLIGGNVNEGRRIFEERSDLACTRCHAVKGNGGTVGPALDGIGGKQTREYLLESILQPNKQIAKGYDNLLVTHAGGQTAGVVIRETGVAVEINSLEDGPVTIPKADIRNISRGMSAMPEGLGQMLTPFELRNLVEYLASLK
ncbi:MAG TPA: PQQ-dependent sugar dehydrogenase [Verrucomicrobiae bacterium]|nr:PQQ-dependent sugar dehydrogenase [Verrucomicrobiae bacterium]